MRVFFPAAVLAIVVLMTSMAVAGSEETAPKAVVFYAMGDVPRGDSDDVLLPKQIAELPNDADFLIHLGDIKQGSTLCAEPIYRKVSGMLEKSRAPTFIVPGDNEWNDCTHPAVAWELWEKYFLRFEQHWQHRLPVFRQLEREENFSFLYRGVLFIGLNIVGGRIHDPQEWPRRHAENLAWVQQNLRQLGDRSDAVVIFGHAHPRRVHNDFFLPLCEEAKKDPKPWLYLHGDGHRWLEDRPFSAKNILRVQVDQGEIAPPLKVVVDSNATKVFQFDRRLPIETAPSE